MKIALRLYVGISLVALVALGITAYLNDARADEAEALNTRVVSLIIRPGQDQQPAPMQTQRVAVQAQNGQASASTCVTVTTPAQQEWRQQSLAQILDAEQAVIDDYNRRNPNANARLGLRVTDRLEAYNRQFMKSASNVSY